MQYGIDLSSHNGILPWDKLSKKIDFAIIRAGYGKGNFDTQAEHNASMATLYKIPFGLYWFSYAKNEEEAREEAESLYSFNNSHHALYPLFFDLEDDTLRYTGISKSDKLRITAIANAFCSRIEELGGYAAIYCSSDYRYNVYEQWLFEKFDLWLANWKSNGINNIFEIPFNTKLWQCSSEGVITGMSKVDIDICDFDYPTLIVEKKLNL